ncbi:MAG: methyltransferase domain-containing protein [Alphaproteobacteria bacterium]|nr:methyltransferase domain-containing protein [Alphaproteobacteria bacterium]
MTNFEPPNPRPRTFGPVTDLERHLPADWWRDLFNEVYLKTDGDVVENDENTRREVDLVLSATGIGPGDRVLDLCCGQGRHSLELARRGFPNVTGLDRSRYLVRLARKRAKAMAIDVRFREGDARKFALAREEFDCVVLMGNSFGYFAQEEDDLAVLTAIKRALRSRGQVAIDLTEGDWMRENFEPRSWEWVDANQFVCRERSLSADRSRLISREVVVHAEKGVIADQFYAERLYSKVRITALLERAEFSDIRFHDVIEAQSSRGDDLGMMARRNFLTARAPVRQLPAARVGVPIPNVTVILGDPRRPDSVKRNGVFNAEDLDTVARLKNALGSLKNYHFSYFDDHEKLAAELRDTGADFVLNLCDEGLWNDALMELHVPAMLEMLGIPYSGAGPIALGLCYNKTLVRAVAASCDIPVPLESYFGVDDQSATIPSIFPALIKPNTGDSSIGITQNAVVANPTEAVAYLDGLRRTLSDRAVLVQEFLTGPEYSVGLIGNPGIDLSALPVLEVDYSGLAPELPRILGYESKWLPDSPYWNDIRYREAHITEENRRDMVHWSTVLFERLGCRDYARFDFRAGADGIIKLLEVNPNPGWCWDGKFNLMARFSGYDYPELLRMILEAAQRRVRENTRGSKIVEVPAVAMQA